MTKRKRKRKSHRNEQLRLLKKLKAANSVARKREVAKLDRLYERGGQVLRALLARAADAGAADVKEVIAKWP